MNRIKSIHILIVGIIIFYCWDILNFIKIGKGIGKIYPVEIEFPFFNTSLKLNMEKINDTIIEVNCGEVKFKVEITKKDRILKGNILLFSLPEKFIGKKVPYLSFMKAKIEREGKNIIYKRGKKGILITDKKFVDTLNDMYVFGIKQGKRIEFQFSPGLKLFQKILPPGKRYKYAVIGKRENIYKNPYLFPPYLDHPLTEIIDKAIKEGVILLKNGRLMIDTTTSPLWKRIFEWNPDSGFLWVKALKALSGRRNSRKFNPYFLKPFRIENGSLKGIYKWYLRVGMDEDIILIQKRKEQRRIRDRNGTPIFNSEDLTLKDSIIGSVFPSSYFLKALWYILNSQKLDTLFLSIDLNLQSILEKSIDDFLKKYFYKNQRIMRFYLNKIEKRLPPIGAVIISEKGEILAYISIPRNDGINRVWKRVYPIGSTIKPLIGAVGLDGEEFIRKGGKFFIPKAGKKNVIFSDPDGVIYEIGNKKLFKPIHNYKNFKFPHEITLKDMIAYSINTASCNLFASFSSKNKYRFFSLMFFNENIPLLGEEYFPEFSLFTGYNEVNLEDIDQVARVGIGDKIYLSLLWLTTLFRMLYENNLVLPTLLKVKDPEIVLDNVFETDLKPLYKALKEVIEKGTASYAVKKYGELRKLIVGAKTGTAEIPDLPAHKLFVTKINYSGFYIYMGVIVENGEVFKRNPAILITMEFLKNLKKEAGI